MAVDGVQPFSPDVQVVGEANPDAIVHAAIALRMRNADALDALNQRHRRVSPAVLDSTYLPEPARYAAICSWLAASGLSLEQTHSSRLSIDFAGSVGQLSRVFKLHFSSIVSKGTSYISADSAPSVPAGFADAILGINRLQPQLRPHPLIIRRPMSDGSSTPPAPPFIPADINRAYAADHLATTGQRSTIAIIIDTFPQSSDLTAYWNMVNVPQSLSNITFVQTYSGTMGAPTGEETLDTEIAGAFAPSGKVRIYGCTDLNYVDDDFEQVISDMQSGIAITQVSMSFGGTESDTGRSEIHTEHQYFATITAMGGSPFAASGDDGIYGNGERKVQPLYPASDPDVTGVGATSLYFSASSAVSQTGWSCTGTFDNCSSNGASGGGLSTVFGTPKYQSGIALATTRAIPDLSLVGDPNTGVLIIFNGREEQDGGTSVSAPLMAAYAGLINDTRLAAGKASLGMLNTRLYRVTSPSALTDITTGDNGDMAGMGYDLVTGIGTPVMSVLLKALAKQP